QTVMELEQVGTVAGMVKAGMGLTVVPTLTLFYFEGPDLVTLPIDAPELRRQIFVVRRRDRTLSAAAQALYEAMLAARPRLRNARALRRTRKASAP
ncbi:MAG TPA: LysR substrate-binding domain-containing protein, partial [Rubrivivax sp.]|nr:LysR substrate-binding domain-containing protein [Rubrivivax sp.]